MTTVLDRFRRWYDYERDCNAKTLAMLESVPAEERWHARVRESGRPDGALDRGAAALAASARRVARPAADFSDGTHNGRIAATARRNGIGMGRILKQFERSDLARVIEWTAPTGQQFRWDIEGILTPNADPRAVPSWANRTARGTARGRAVDTDYLYWCNPSV